MKKYTIVFAFVLMIVFGLVLIANGQPAAPPVPPDDTKPVRIVLDVTKDTKIMIDGKAVPFAKFAVVLEFAAGAFDVDEATYKDGKFISLKLVTRPSK